MVAAKDSGLIRHAYEGKPCWVSAMSNLYWGLG